MQFFGVQGQPAPQTVTVQPVEVGSENGEDELLAWERLICVPDWLHGLGDRGVLLKVVRCHVIVLRPASTFDHAHHAHLKTYGLRPTPPR